MKKFILLGIVATLFTVGASAQSRRGDYKKDYPKTDRHHMAERNDRRFDDRTHSLTRGERAKMRHNAAAYHRQKHKAYRDGRLSRHEQRQLAKMKKDNRRQAYRYKHNGRHRVM
jgi:hypothetical protein